MALSGAAFILIKVRISRKSPLAPPSHAIDRLWSMATDNDVQHPSADRIKGDIHKVERSLMSIIEADGAMVDGLGNRNGVRAKMSTEDAPSKRGGARVAGVSTKPHNASTFRHSDSNGLCETILMAAKMKFEQCFNNDTDDEDGRVNVDEIFKLRTAFTRNSTTKGAMREPLRTIWNQTQVIQNL